MIEREADPIGMASQLHDQNNEQAVESKRREEAQRILNVKELISLGAWDGCTCTKCGEDLPALRVAEYRLMCVPCQGALEHNNRLRR